MGGGGGGGSLCLNTWPWGSVFEPHGKMDKYTIQHKCSTVNAPKICPSEAESDHSKKAQVMLRLVLSNGEQIFF